jgi:ferric-dicitrate binding protein FerR (iron transport regulator)
VTAATRPEDAASPELALVDPELGAELRASLEHQKAAERTNGTEGTTQAREALQRLLELSYVEPPRRMQRLETAKLGLAVGTWGTFLLLVVETKLPPL